MVCAAPHTHPPHPSVLGPRTGKTTLQDTQLLSDNAETGPQALGPGSCSLNPRPLYWKGNFSKDIQAANKPTKRCSTPLTTREIQIKTTKYCLTPTRMAIILKKENNKPWQGCGETRILVLC